MVGLEGFEPPTHGLGNRCSIRLSYRPKWFNYQLLTTISLYSKPLVDDADNEESASFSLPQARLVRTVLRLVALDASARITRACVVDCSIELY